MELKNFVILSILSILSCCSKDSVSNNRMVELIGNILINTCMGEQQPYKNDTVTIIAAEETLSIKTDSIGYFKLNIPENSQIRLMVDRSTYAPIDTSFSVGTNIIEINNQLFLNEYCSQLKGSIIEKTCLGEQGLSVNTALTIISNQDTLTAITNNNGEFNLFFSEESIIRLIIDKAFFDIIDTTLIMTSNFVDLTNQLNLTEYYRYIPIQNGNRWVYHASWSTRSFGNSRKISGEEIWEIGYFNLQTHSLELTVRFKGTEIVSSDTTSDTTAHYDNTSEYKCEIVNNLLLIVSSGFVA